VAWLEDPDLSIGVSMDYDSWKAGSRYNALHISKKIIEIIRALHAADLIDLNKGSYGGPDAKGNRTTRIRASETLRQWFVDALAVLPVSRHPVCTKYREFTGKSEAFRAKLACLTPSLAQSP
jgi:hypothetical protein